MKKCNKCETEKELCEFTRDNSKKDGLSNRCKSCAAEYMKRYEVENSEKRKEYYKTRNKTYYKNNKNKIAKTTKEYRVKNKIYYKEYNSEYKKNNREVLNEKNRIKRKTNDVFKISENIRTSINRTMKKKGLKKHSKTIEILGCSFEEFKTHLESKFEPWMNWDNYAKYNGTENYGWDIDHITPISSAKTVEDVVKLNHFTNLQPLCSYINRDVKKNKLDF